MEAMIDETNAEDTVLIYYVGHGEFVEDTAPVSDLSTPARYQFMVPFDYLADASPDTEHSDVGIADLLNSILYIKIANLLYSTTQRTGSVTTIRLLPFQDPTRTGKIPSPLSKSTADGNSSAVHIAATLRSFPA
jgi:hypothetical protein